MLERFDSAGRLVLIRAQAEARRFGRRAVGSEHLLLGLLEEPSAASLLFDTGITIDEVRFTVEQIAQRGVPTLDEGLPFDDEALDVFDAAAEEADGFGHEVVGGAHLLLGLIKEPFGLGGRVLEAHGAALDGMRHEALELIACDDEVDVDAA